MNRDMVIALLVLSLLSLYLGWRDMSVRLDSVFASGGKEVERDGFVRMNDAR